MPIFLEYGEEIPDNTNSGEAVEPPEAEAETGEKEANKEIEN